MTTCYIGLGSNMCQPVQQLVTARDAIDKLEDCKLIRCSSIYQSKALTLDDEPQDDYCNAVIKIETQLSAEALLDALQRIENNQGRVRTKRWGARTLDLDIILYGSQSIQTQRLIVPHAEMANRDFVLLPLYEIAPDVEIPGNKTLKELTANYENSSLKIVGEFNG